MHGSHQQFLSSGPCAERQSVLTNGVTNLLGSQTAEGETQPRYVSWAPEKKTLGTTAPVIKMIAVVTYVGLMHQQQVIHSSLTTKGKEDEGEKKPRRIYLVSSEGSIFFFLNCVSKNYNTFVCSNPAIPVCKK